MSFINVTGKYSGIEDCRALGIETMPPRELDAMLEDWGRKHEGKP